MLTYPFRKVLKKSLLNLVLTATKLKTVMMLEADAKVVNVNDVMKVPMAMAMAMAMAMLSLSNQSAHDFCPAPRFTSMIFNKIYGFQSCIIVY